MPKVRIDLERTNIEVLQAYAREMSLFLSEAVEFCQNHPPVGGKETLAMPENFEFWMHPEFLPMPSSVTNSFGVVDGNEETKPKNKGFVQDLMKGLKNRIESWEKKAKHSDIESEDLTQAKAFYILLAYLKTRSQELLPEVLAVNNIREVHQALGALIDERYENYPEDFKDLMKLMQDSDDEALKVAEALKFDEEFGREVAFLEELVDDLSTLMDLNHRFSVFSSQLNEQSPDFFSRQEVYEKWQKAEAIYEKVIHKLSKVDDICKVGLGKDAQRYVSALEEAKALHKIKTDINAQFNLKLSLPAEVFQKYQKFAMPASIVLGTVSVVSLGVGVAFPVTAPVTLPLAAQSAKVSLALCAPAILKNVSAMVHNKVRWGIDPNPKEIITLASLSITAGLMGGAAASAANTAINISIVSTQTVLKDLRLGLKVRGQLIANEKRERAEFLHQDDSGVSEGSYNEESGVEELGDMTEFDSTEYEGESSGVFNAPDEVEEFPRGEFVFLDDEELIFLKELKEFSNLSTFKTQEKKPMRSEPTALALGSSCSFFKCESSKPKPSRGLWQLALPDSDSVAKHRAEKKADEGEQQAHQDEPARGLEPSNGPQV